MKEVGYYNGTIGPLSEISCPILDRAVYFGDGCYDATYVQNGVIFALEDHFDRFYNSCRLLRIPFQYSREELEKILYSLVGLMMEMTEREFFTGRLPGERHYGIISSQMRQR